MERTYYVGFNVEVERIMVVVNLPLSQIPFNVWRDISHCSSQSFSTPTKEIFFLYKNEDVLSLEKIRQVEEILQGALFEREK